MQSETQNSREFCQAMCQWTNDYATDRQYGDARWERLGKKAGLLAYEGNISDDWTELSPEDIVTIADYH